MAISCIYMYMYVRILCIFKEREFLLLSVELCVHIAAHNCVGLAMSCYTYMYVSMYMYM